MLIIVELLYIVFKYNPIFINDVHVLKLWMSFIYIKHCVYRLSDKIQKLLMQHFESDMNYSVTHVVDNVCITAACKI